VKKKGSQQSGGAEKEFIFPGTEKFALSPIFEGGYMKLYIEGMRVGRTHSTRAVAAVVPRKRRVGVCASG